MALSNGDGECWMCRLLAYVATEARPPQEAVGEGTWAAFRSLSCIHGDGWGGAWTEDGKPPSVSSHRSTTAAADDPSFAALGREVSARAAFFHLRWATTGLAVRPENTHPFVADGWAFAHNGFVRGSERIADLLPTRHRSALAGTTDSERYFRLVLHFAEQAGDIVAGLQTAARTILDIGGPVSINALLLSPTRLLAVHGLAGARPPTDDLLALVEHPDRLPQDHLDGYFHLAHREVDGTLTVASSGLPRDGWTPLPPNSVMDVDVATGGWAQHPLLGEPAAVGGEPVGGTAAGPV
jgi:predicted glutamine amidotransferase